jgi:hypothetical protein
MVQLWSSPAVRGTRRPYLDGGAELHVQNLRPPAVDLGRLALVEKPARSRTRPVTVA